METEQKKQQTIKYIISWEHLIYHLRRIDWRTKFKINQKLQLKINLLYIKKKLKIIHLYKIQNGNSPILVNNQTKINIIETISHNFWYLAYLAIFANCNKKLNNHLKFFFVLFFIIYNLICVNKLVLYKCII